jgi:hypothetical protein
MSSARSISGARARRAGEQTPTVIPQPQIRSQPQYISSGQPQSQPQPQPQPQPMQPMQQQRPFPGQGNPTQQQLFSPRPIGQQKQQPQPQPQPQQPQQQQQQQQQPQQSPRQIPRGGPNNPIPIPNNSNPSNPYNPSVNQNLNQNPNPNQNNQNPNNPYQLPGKISISDAFNIVTSRISKIEKFMQELTQPPSEEELQQMQQQQQEENNIFPIIMERIERLEETGLGEIANKKIIEIKNQLVKTQKDLKETKEFLFSLQSNFDSLALELNDKIERKYNELYEMIVINQGNIHPMIPPTIDSESEMPQMLEQQQEPIEEEIEELEFEDEESVVFPYISPAENENIVLEFDGESGSNNDDHDVSSSSHVDV